jgi:hypothetical protein
MAASHPHRHGPARSERTLERAATWLSLACAVHCLVLPIAMSVLPLVSATGFSDLHPRAELALTIMVVASALAGAAWGYRRHGDTRIVYATGAGLLAYLVGHVFEHSWFGIALAVSGALVLAASSFVSARLTHSCDDASCAS